MANANKIVVVVAILAVLQVSCAVARRHRDAEERGIPAVMTVNGFRRGESGGGPAACDGHFHSDGELIVALSTEWFEHGRRCDRKIRITSTRDGGRTVEARVVDECDSGRGCRGNIVDSSPAVWRALGLDTSVGEVPVTWSDA